MKSTNLLILVAVAGGLRLLGCNAMPQPNTLVKVTTIAPSTTAPNPEVYVTASKFYLPPATCTSSIQSASRFTNTAPSTFILTRPAITTAAPAPSTASTVDLVITAISVIPGPDTTEHSQPTMATAVGTPASPPTYPSLPSPSPTAPCETTPPDNSISWKITLAIVIAILAVVVPATMGVPRCILDIKELFA